MATRSCPPVAHVRDVPVRSTSFSWTLAHGGRHACRSKNYEAGSCVPQRRLRYRDVLADPSVPATELCAATHSASRCATALPQMPECLP